jgi:hypothetical protein
VRRAVALIAILGCIAGTFALLLWFWTHPTLISLRISVVGPVSTYRSLAGDDERWTTVVSGVRSGEADWLRIAARLHGVLDTHPGEQMLEAVAVAFDKNPDGAIRILVPAYGPEIVCAQTSEGEPLTPSQANRRMELLRQSNSLSGEIASACARALSRLATRAHSVH